MPRRRKVVQAVEEEHEFVKPKPKSTTKPVAKKQKTEPDWMQGNGADVINLILSVQKTDVNNTKITAELTKLYSKMGHVAFMETFMKVLLMFIIRDENDDYSLRVLKFLGMFVASFGEEVAPDGGSHQLIHRVFDEILSTSSKLYHIRARICVLVTNIMNSFSQKAEIDETLMDMIVHRILASFIKDVSPVVRQNAIMALQRLQDPENPEDQVTKAYVFHMETDPIARVRQAAITAIAKKLPIIPHILDRLRDNDEKVRRHTYLQMVSFPVKSYKIVDRIKILKAGLYDRSAMVQKTVLNLLLPNWVAAYDNNFAQFVRAFKLDASDNDIISFRNLTHDSLIAIFKKQKISDLISHLNLKENTEFQNCISLEKAKALEWLIVWKVALKLHQEHIAKMGPNNDDQGEESDSSESNPVNESVSNITIMPELSVLCDFFEKFLVEFKNSDEIEAKHEKLTFNHCVILLLEIAQLNDFGDEIGCNRLKMLCRTILSEHDMTEFGVQEVAKIVEALIPNQSQRLKFFNEIVSESVNLGTPTEYSRQTIIEELLSKCNMDMQVKVNGLKMQMMELKEAEANFVAKKKYGDAQAVSEKFATLNAELVELLRPVAEESSTASQALAENLSAVPVGKKLKTSEIHRNLRICFYSVMTKGVKALTPDSVHIYKNFVCYHLESTDIIARIWALKTATAYALLYEAMAKDVYMVLKTQLFKSTSVLIWEAVIACIVDLLLRYSKEKMEVATGDDANSSQQSKKGGRSLYTDDGEETDEVDLVASVDIVQMLIKVLEGSSVDIRVHRAVLVGICKLILHGQYCTKEIIGKFLLSYFNPATEAEISQTLGVFFESVIRMRKQECLHEALIPTMKILLEAPGDSPLREVKMETVIKYVIGATRPVFCSNGLNLHNTLGLKLIEVMKENPENKEIQKVVARELMLLEISDDSLLKKDMVALIDTLLKETKVDIKTKKNISDFREILLGTYRPPLKFSSTTATITTIDEDAGEHDEEEDQEESEDVPQTFTSEDIIDISMSNVKMKKSVVNVFKLRKSQFDFSKTLVPESPSKSIFLTQPDDSEDIDIPETQQDEIPETKLKEIPETQESENESSGDDEHNETVIESLIENSDEEETELPETPESSQEKAIATPKSRKSVTSKRHLELSLSHRSPLSKNPRHGASPKPLTPQSNFKKRQDPKTPSTPKTPRHNNTSTPLERTTRSQGKEAVAQSLTLTRSASRTLNVDPIEIANKITSSPRTPRAKDNKQQEEPKKKKEAIAKQTKIPKPTKTSLIRAAKAAAAPQPSTSRVATTEGRVTRKKTAGESRPRWN